MLERSPLRISNSEVGLAWPCFKGRRANGLPSGPINCVPCSVVFLDLTSSVNPILSMTRRALPEMSMFCPVANNCGAFSTIVTSISAFASQKANAGPSERFNKLIVRCYSHQLGGPAMPAPEMRTCMMRVAKRELAQIATSDLPRRLNCRCAAQAKGGEEADQKRLRLG